MKWCSEQASTPDLCSSPCGSWHSTSEGWYLSLYTWHFRCWCIWLLSWSERGRAGSGHIHGGGVESWTEQHVDGSLDVWGRLLGTGDPSCLLAGRPDHLPSGHRQPSSPLSPLLIQRRSPGLANCITEFPRWVGGGVTVGLDCSAFQQ